MAHSSNQEKEVLEVLNTNNSTSLVSDRCGNSMNRIKD